MPFSSFSGAHFKVPKLSRSCRIHLWWIMQCCSQMSSSRPAEPSSNCRDSAAAGSQLCPSLETALGCRKLPHSRSHPSQRTAWSQWLAGVGTRRQAPLPQFGTTLKSHPSPMAPWREGQLRPQSLLHCGSASPVQLCLPHCHTRVSPKSTHQ